ncbi:hypothetical protein Pmar_PMAR020133 [Perkinsus marinus ATCC 50983]|uniref:Uncharacterized protein n=2 Tax=Perkinsus marinus (strain ATCC 50983 / TXsc) TaxID=423536 RepID=C5KLE4_PERM5|nr:hypothetical protein Pmar_PMAR020133 [Perkinsus marinus ATCC 50983]EER14699.1 hypothetical protein Pmar_PMAR020133 [Perkinsus marinus ATCC 50983]|eukprot:XP_002782903.1 hypothetical protein Pmar_PMAR020133 [Perkinsus marinus ATCC 50983]
MIISSIVLIQLLAYGVPLVQAGSYMETYQKYDGFNEEGIYCIMTVKELTQARLVADIELSNGDYDDTCNDVDFDYEISTSGTTNRTTALRESYKLQASSLGVADDDCLQDLASDMNMGSHCRFNAYPKNGHMIFEACNSRFDLSPKS